MQILDHEELYLQYHEEIKEEFPDLSEGEVYNLAMEKTIEHLADYGDYMADRMRDQMIDDAIDRGIADPDKGDTEDG
jgi:hypothetical protein